MAKTHISTLFCHFLFHFFSCARCSPLDHKLAMHRWRGPVMNSKLPNQTPRPCWMHHEASVCHCWCIYVRYNNSFVHFASVVDGSRKNVNPAWFWLCAAAASGVRGKFLGPELLMTIYMKSMSSIVRRVTFGRFYSVLCTCYIFSQNSMLTRVGGCLFVTYSIRLCIVPILFRSADCIVK